MGNGSGTRSTLARMAAARYQKTTANSGALTPAVFQTVTLQTLREMGTPYTIGNGIYRFEHGGRSYIAKQLVDSPHGTAAEVARKEVVVGQMARTAGLRDYVTAQHAYTRDGTPWLVARVAPGENLGVFANRLLAGREGRGDTRRTGFDYQVAAMARVPGPAVMHLALFEWLVGDSDRASENYLYSRSGRRLTAIDFGAAFTEHHAPFGEAHSRALQAWLKSQPSGSRQVLPMGAVNHLLSSRSALTRLAERVSPQAAKEVSDRLDLLQRAVDEHNGQPTLRNLYEIHLPSYLRGD